MNDLKDLLIQNIGSLILQKMIDECLNLGFDDVLTKRKACVTCSLYWRSCLSLKRSSINKVFLYFFS